MSTESNNPSNNDPSSSAADSNNNPINQSSDSNNSNPNNPAILVSDTGIPLVPAELRDLNEGSDIYIRGKPAICIRFDYPHVYWRFPSMPIDTEKHRSFTSSPHIFAVDPTKRDLNNSNNQSNRRSGSFSRTDTGELLDEIDHSNNGSNSNNPNNTVNDSNNDTDSSANELSETYKTDAVVVKTDTTPTTTAARPSLATLFGAGPKKLLYSNLIDSTIINNEAKFPQSIHIENCSNSTIELKNKLISITLLNCNNLIVKFASLINRLELIGSSNITIYNTNQCKLYQIENSKNLILYCNLSNLDSNSDNNSDIWLLDNDNIQFITINTEQCNIILTTTKNQSNNNENLEINENIKYLIPNITTTTTNNNSDSDNSDSKNDSIDQQRTIYSYNKLKNEWEFNTELLQRQGMRGYFSNN